MIPHLIRDSAPGDHGFILRTWKMQLRHTYPFAAIDSDATVLAAINKPVDTAFEESRCRVACAPDNPDTILGFVVGRPEPSREGTLHIVYTKTVYRRMGLAKILLAEMDMCTVATMWPRFAEVYGPRHGYTPEPSRLWANPALNREPENK